MSMALDSGAKNSYKILIAGPVGAGKTEAIRVLSDKAVITTEAHASDEIKELKETTTVAMDYGIMNLENGEQVRLYGTPGQKRFDFMWEILSENALGLILLLNAENEDPVADLHDYLSTFLPMIKQSALAIGITHSEEMPWHLQHDLSAALSEMNLPANVMPVDARDKVQMRQLVRSLIYTIIT